MYKHKNKTREEEEKSATSDIQPPNAPREQRASSKKERWYCHDIRKALVLRKREKRMGKHGKQVLTMAGETLIDSFETVAGHHVAKSGFFTKIMRGFSIFVTKIGANRPLTTLG